MNETTKEAAYIFPGQGAQYVGMGKDLYDSYPQAKEVFEKANEILKIDIMKLCFEGPQEELSLTPNCQPAILVTSIAALRAFESTKDQGTVLKFSLGLSLGEYTALVAVESISFEDALILVRKRGELMETASKKNPGKMACVLGMDLSDVEELCKGIGCEIANLNCPGQVVVSGKTRNIDLLASLAKAKGAKRVIELDVSGPFHSSLMAQAGEKLRQYIETTKIEPPKVPFISNVDAEVQSDPVVIKKNLIKQVSSGTLWERSIRLVASTGVNDYLEIGPGKVLKGLLKKIDPSLQVKNIETSADLQAPQAETQPPAA
ncbi:MAG: ACP S-malonyltransferase [Candidatus Omnitrophota bacterium]